MVRLTLMVVPRSASVPIPRGRAFTPPVTRQGRKLNVARERSGVRRASMESEARRSPNGAAPPPAPEEAEGLG
jgi:hypothetical protein